MKKHAVLLSTLVGCTLVTSASAMELNPLFQDHAVLQCDAQVPIWGTGRDGEKITVAFGGQTVSTTVVDGKWKVWLAPMKANASPQKLVVRGDNTLEASDVLVGEVWIASGQSNMERQLGLRAGQQPILDWESEVAAAKYPQIRQFQVPQIKSFSPQSAVKGPWAVCSPQTASDFSAVGYFFARDLFAARKVPVGIIFSAWGGTPAEAWTSAEGLRSFPEFGEALGQVSRLAAEPQAMRKETRMKQDAWYREMDPGSSSAAPWSAPDLETADWSPAELPSVLGKVAGADFDGVFWFRRTFELADDWDGGDAQLRLGGVDDIDTTWVNGEEVGATDGWNVHRVYQVPGRLLKRGKNVIAVRVLDTGAGGGLYGGDAMRLVCNSGGKSVALDGQWLAKAGVSLRAAGSPPADLGESAGTPTVLYNGMIAPLQPYAMRGVIWYQGEANVGRERQYRTLFPAMIADWRRVWDQGDFPFLFVQIAPWKGMTPEIREAQLLTTKTAKNTAMAVTIDCGDVEDIHPTHKQPVGARLALAARALAYGEKIEYSGPVFESMKTKGAEVVLNFTHLGGGLVAKEGNLKGFTLAGTDKVFHPAKAEIRGSTIVVSAANVSSPVAVRYAWANAPEGNLFNRAGLPASPFRTDPE